MRAELIRAKLVMVGAPGVGKTSLTRRYIHSIFSEEYHSTLGVKVDRKSMVVDGHNISLILWDMHGETTGLAIPAGYLRGAAAALVVFDATRPETIDKAAELQGRVLAESPAVTVRVVANKTDLPIDWPAVEAGCAAQALPVPIPTSAKTGNGVEEVFTSIGRELATRN